MTRVVSSRSTAREHRGSGHHTFFFFVLFRVESRVHFTYTQGKGIPNQPRETKGAVIRSADGDSSERPCPSTLII